MCENVENNVTQRVTLADKIKSTRHFFNSSKFKKSVENYVIYLC